MIYEEVPEFVSILKDDNAVITNKLNVHYQDPVSVNKKGSFAVCTKGLRLCL